MPQPMPNELVYNDLTGEDCKQILCQRFADLLSRVPGLTHNMTLPRVKMTLSVRLEMFGCAVPERTITDAMLIRSSDPAPELSPPTGYTVETVVDSSPTGQPPDEIREEHGLPVPTPKRDAATGVIQDAMIKPVTREGRTWAAFVEQDRGGPVSAGYEDYKVPGQGVIGAKNVRR